MEVLQQGPGAVLGVKVKVKVNVDLYSASS